ncbi:MAG: formylglycine-generating enzyme family protein [Candidatus Sumerlaeota bacterium]|nr:formylglycine-generating enzyme family protein [Candidatus Sumerlaeota bacterium]
MGAPTLETVTDIGDGMAHLAWSNSWATPLQFLGFSFDLYAFDWVRRFWEGTLWAPFPAGAASGDMDLAFTGGYYVWISNQYSGGNWYPCDNPWGGIIYSGKPHTPRNLVAQRQRSANVRLKWKPDLYGTWCYQMIAYKDGEGFIDTLGPGGISLWHFVDYGGAAYGEYEASFSEGWADFWLPWGTYWFFVCGVGWLPPYPTGDYVWASATVLPERSFDLPGDVPLRMIRLPSGHFQMGSPDAERSRQASEGPVHEVTIDYTVYLGKFEVTQQQWMAVMGSNPAHDYGVGDNYPVYCVSWNDCRQFLGALNALGLEGVFRLPSEAEWEYACRAGTQTRFFFGDSLGADDDAVDAPAGTLPDNRSDYMWYRFNSNGDANGAYGSHPCGAKLPNNFQFFDMSGNVWEWWGGKSALSLIRLAWIPMLVNPPNAY